MTRFRLAALVLIAIFVGAALAFIATEQERAREATEAEAESATRLTHISSVLQNIDVAWVPAPEDPGAGGALVPWRDGLLFLARTGEIHALRPDDSGFDKLGFTIPFDLEAQVAMFDTRINRFSIGGRGMAVRERDGVIDVYMAHTVGYPARDCLTVAVSRTRATEGPDGLLGQSGSWTRVFETTPCLEAKHSSIIALQAGGLMAVHPDGGILVEIGDFSIDTVFRDRDTVYPQDPNVSYGKVWHLDAVSDAPRIFSLGHRNASGLTVTPDGRIWMTEHGPKGGDEVNLIRDGANYGWPLVTYGVKYGEATWPPNEETKLHPETVEPIFSWIPSIAVSGVVEVAGAEFPKWRGDILAGSLVGQKLVRLRLVDGSRVVYVEEMDLGHRIRALTQLASGQLALKLDWEPYILLLSAQDAPEEDIPTALVACAGCHALSDDGLGGSGPTLANVMNSKIAGVSGFDYSTALKSAKGEWTQERLAVFLSDPAAFAPGTKMANPGLTDEEVSQVLSALSDLAAQKLE